MAYSWNSPFSSSWLLLKVQFCQKDTIGPKQQQDGSDTREANIQWTDYGFIESQVQAIKNTLKRAQQTKADHTDRQQVIYTSWTPILGRRQQDNFPKKYPMRQKKWRDHRKTWRKAAESHQATPRATPEATYHAPSKSQQPSNENQPL